MKVSHTRYNNVLTLEFSKILFCKFEFRNFSMSKHYYNMYEKLSQNLCKTFRNVFGDFLMKHDFSCYGSEYWLNFLLPIDIISLSIVADKMFLDNFFKILLTDVFYQVVYPNLSMTQIRTQFSYLRPTIPSFSKKDEISPNFLLF